MSSRFAISMQSDLPETIVVLKCAMLESAISDPSAYSYSYGGLELWTALFITRAQRSAPPSGGSAEPAGLRKCHFARECQLNAEQRGRYRVSTFSHLRQCSGPSFVHADGQQKLVRQTRKDRVNREPVSGNWEGQRTQNSTLLYLCGEKSLDCKD